MKDGTEVWEKEKKNHSQAIDAVGKLMKPSAPKTSRKATSVRPDTLRGKNHSQDSERGTAREKPLNSHNPGIFDTSDLYKKVIKSNTNRFMTREEQINLRARLQERQRLRLEVEKILDSVWKLNPLLVNEIKQRLGIKLK